MKARTRFTEQRILLSVGAARPRHVVTAVGIDIYHVKETIVRYLLCQPFQQSFCVGADPSWLVEEQESKSLLEVEKALEHRGFLLGVDFCRTFDKNKQEDSHASGNCPPSTSETGLFLPQLGSDLRKKLSVGRSPRPRRGPAPIVAPPPAQPGMLSGAGRAGRFAWPPAVAGAGSACGWWVPFPRLNPGKLRAEAGF